ncbi:VOC family protein [Zobellia uliginosa]|uniref:VOC family protein n=1 Tax=Zobellia uliginosa TaxID=143224 RepID=UPI001C06F551|nr:VOC family protein [Zobellia uliginosa]MBU2948634.1 VOC family protein [Zobellia uliginosa]
MIFEHFALNVTDIKKRVNWFVTHLGLKVVVAKENSPFMTFLADSTDRVILELYQKEDQPMTNFQKQEPSAFHVAFVSNDAESDKQRLIAEGATLVEEIKRKDAHLVMLRDPWGMPLQLCERAINF